MKALVLTSTSLRHMFFVSEIAKAFDLVGALAEEKRNYYVAQKEESERVRSHFSALSKAEERYFSSRIASDAPDVHKVQDINDPKLVAWAQGQSVDVVCLFGTSILGQAWLRAFPDKIVNLHLGLSPWYRGSATLFWPFADAALEYLGTTIHLAVAKVDAGAILHRIQPDLEPGEGYYALTNRLIRESIEAFPGVVQDYLVGVRVPHAQEVVSGRLCRKADFDDAALERALEYADHGLDAMEISRIEEAKKCLCLP